MTYISMSNPTIQNPNTGGYLDSNMRLFHTLKVWNRGTPIYRISLGVYLKHQLKLLASDLLSLFADLSSLSNLAADNEEENDSADDV